MSQSISGKIKKIYIFKKVIFGAKKGVEHKVAENWTLPRTGPHTIRITLPFNDPKSAEYVRRELRELGNSIGRVFTTSFHKQENPSLVMCSI